jgi:hypothetical protein
MIEKPKEEERMKRSIIFGLVLALVLVAGYGTSFGLMSADGTKLSGPHEQFNIIGHPDHPRKEDCISGDNSNGRAVMIPLKNVSGPSELVCNAEATPDEQTVFVDDEYPTWVTQEPAGAKIYFECGDSFDIIDRDGCDNNGATIQVKCDTEEDPLDSSKTQDVIAYDVYMRVLGKPDTCMNIEGFAYDSGQGLWFWSGTVYLNRTGKKSTFVKVTDLFDVWWCNVVEVSGNGNGTCETGEVCECDTGTEVELSVFNDVFENYFWNILNDGTRLVQVRLYPK